MPETYTTELLSGRADGLQIKVSQIVTAGNTIHTAHATAKDLVWLYAVNLHAADVILTIEWGEATAPDGNMKKTIKFKDGLKLIIPGLPLTNSKVVKAFADVTNVIMISGFVHRITP